MKNKLPAPASPPGTVPTRPLPADFWERAKVEAPSLWEAREQERRWGEEAARYRTTPAGQAARAKADAFWEETRAAREQRAAEFQRTLVAKSKAPAYAVLGLAFGAPLPEIKKAYRKRAHKAHPDAGGSHAQMTLLNTAYQTLIQK